MNEEKIAAAVERCLKQVAEKRLFINSSAYLDALRHDPDWSEAEVTEVQTRVVRVLMARLRERGWPPDMPLGQ